MSEEVVIPPTNVFWSWVSPEGQIMGRFSGPPGSEVGQVAGDWILKQGWYDTETQYFADLEDEEPTDRPIALEETIYSIPARPAPNSLLSLDVPLGTQVFFNGGYLGESDDEIFEFGHTRPGVYRIKISPPFPYQEQWVEVTVE